MTIAGGVVVAPYRLNLRESAERAIDASKEHGRAWLLDDRGGGVMFSHGELQEQLFGAPTWHVLLVAVLSEGADA